MVLKNFMFNPGDKVMRVGDNTPGVPLFSGWPVGCGPKRGKIYVIHECWDGGHVKLCAIVGYPIVFNAAGMQCGWPCSAFRKLSEIKAENAFRTEVAQGYASSVQPRTTETPALRGLGAGG